MKTKIPSLFLILACLAGVQRTAAQGTAFTYQGQLMDSGAPANGLYDIRTSLFPTNTGGILAAGFYTNLAVPVSNGLFIITMDFGDVFTGTSYWLQIGVRTNGTGANFTPLSPRVELSPSPYAIYATSAGSTALLNNYGSLNFFAGQNSGNSALSGSDNTGVGFGTLFSNTIGSYNTAQGVGALSANTSGSYGTADGVGALFYNTTGADNTAVGFDALFANTDGANNTATGTDALLSNTNGSKNTAEGAGALFFNVAGSNNVANGFQALWQNTTGSCNMADGAYALCLSTTGSNNIALGYVAGYNLTTGSSNIEIGNPGLATDTNLIRIGLGQSQTFLAGVITGDGGGLINLNASQVTSGTIPLAQLPATVAMLSDAGTGNFFAGPSAGNPTLAGGLNTGMGNSALLSDTTGSNNTAEGAGALQLNTIGSYNAGFGAYALLYNLTGSNNTANGAYALVYNTTASYNTGTGAYALSAYSVTAGGNTADGAYTLYSDQTGYNNTAAGYRALYSDTTGFDNVGIGVDALPLNVAGYQNTAVGTYALQIMTAGTGNVAIGCGAGNSLVAGTNNIYIGNGGSSADNEVIRIGNGQTATYIAGAIESPTIVGGAIVTPSIVGGTMTSSTIVGAIMSVPTITSPIMTNAILLGNVGINTGSPSQALEVNGEFLMVDGLGGVDCYMGDDGIGNDVQVGSLTHGVTQVSFYNAYDNADMHINCSTITITGGSDLAEPFKVSSPSGEIPQGSVVVIDEENPGQLKLSSQAYDTRVAGVISGANGVNPGIQMQQQGLLEGGKNVALTGRVYVQADTSNGVIKPGDLLTTSGTPGHAMKVSDHARASGAILGKAMTSLKEGEGMVLVLMTLQ